MTEQRTSTAEPADSAEPAEQQPPGAGHGPGGSDRSDASDASGGSAGSGGDGGDGASGGDGRQDYRTLMIESLGGWRGMVDSGLPVVVFVIANTIGGLRPAIWSAVGCGALLLVLRLVRKQSVQQAVSGFFGVAIAAFIASRTGEAKGYFLFGIWASFFYAGVFLLSVLLRWPAVGVIWEYVETGTTAWRRERALLRVYGWTTLVWVAVFLARGLVQRYLYDEDRTGWLAFARISMGYPLTLGALGVTLLAVRRVRSRLRAAQTAGGAGTTQAAGTA